ncbi:MAG: sulfite exporter TauE/SafE family protein [Spirochaetales bacterium]
MSGFGLLLLGLPLGFGLGFLGSLTGIGGGFLLMPVLLFLLPGEPAGSLSLVTLLVVFFNALSGTILSARQERVRFRTGVVYGLVSLPLVWVGTQWQGLVPREAFLSAFGMFLLAGAVFLALRPGTAPAGKASQPVWLGGAAISLGIGLLSGFFGVGGGFLFVPLLAFVLRFPLAEATATSQLIVGMGAAWALATNALAHPLPVDPQLVSGLIAGVLFGSPWGTRLGAVWSSQAILRLLGGLLALVGLRFVWP